MKTAIIVPVWKRPEITRVCFENLAKTGLQVFTAVSEKWALEMSNRYGFKPTTIDNDYLGRKKNALIKKALTYEWDQLMESGSDNLFDLETLDEYLSIEADHYGVDCNYFYHPETGRAKYFKIGGEKRIWGAGRVISRKAVEASVPLWDDKGTIYLDAQANTALRNKGYDFSVVSTPLFVDIKSEENLHSYDRFEGKPVKESFIRSKFPELENLSKKLYLNSITNP